MEPLPTGCQVLADPIYFHSILTNLLDNSAKYKDKATGQVTITGAVEGQDFCLTVDDDGPGVPPEALPRLFDVSYRNDPARKNPDQGSGLGLAIVAKSMERMGGTIRAENRPQGGCGWCCASPRRKERWTMKRILIVEDDGAIAAIERDYLMLSDFQVDIAATGPEGLAMGRSGGYDLIPLDLMLPGLDGFALCSTLRETLDIPILMVTARQEDIDKIKGLGLGADDYITKPFSIRELMARVKANIRRAAMAPQTPAPAPEGEALRFGRLVIQKGEATATKDGADLELTPREFELLAYLAAHAGRVFSRQELMERVWNYEGYVGDVRAVDVAIRRLREKVEDDPAQPKYIITRRGAGYYFQQEP